MSEHEDDSVRYRRELQDALGGFGPIELREWDALLGWVRRLAAHNIQLQLELDDLTTDE